MTRIPSLQNGLALDLRAEKHIGKIVQTCEIKFAREARFSRQNPFSES